ncbi:MAG: HRDC domain-containing protein [Anaerolineae bacterium]|nr:HRDC domain-containing protein [Anaerolineae bacterium]
MFTEALNSPVWVQDSAGLKQLAGLLANCRQLAIDTESNGLFAYREQVCLVQISDGINDYLIDSLVLKDLSPLAPIFANPAIEKIFHACEYDILCLKRDFGFTFNNIFDTMVASRILGFKAVGLGGVLEEVFGLKIDKRFQQANWGQRPLIKAMIEYARLDVHYLIPLRERLKQRLEDQGRWLLAQEDFERLTHVEAKKEAFNSADSTWRVAGQHELDPYQAAVLRELIDYREKYAHKHNLPNHKVLGNALLVEISLALPHSLEDLVEHCDISMSLVDRHGQALVNAVEKGLIAEPLRRPCRPKPSQNYLDRLDTLRAWRKNTAQNLNVESDVVLPRDLMENIAARNPADRSSLQEIMREIPWRFENYGDSILNKLQTL